MAVASLSSGTLQFVSLEPLNVAREFWAPSGKALQYGLTRNGASNVWEQPITGGPPRQITHFTSEFFFHGAWSTDHKELFIERGRESRDVILMSNFRQQ
jgi:Tol biopolymer transport system component